MKTKIQIKSIYGDVIFENEKENNTIKDTVEEAVKHKVNLCKANLCKANLYEANLREANLSYSILCGADLRGADLSYTNLRVTDLWRAYLRGANLQDANLSYTNLSGADLCGTNLQGANFSGANLYDADLCGAENVPFIPLNCPSEGSFIAWKRVKDKLIKLEIPEDARRSSATTRKCRCDKAKVLTITDLDGYNPIDEILNTSQEHEVLYKVGEMVYPDSFDGDWWNECSHGIHFFINKDDAINY